jgi:hypothetical protein
MHQQKIGSKKPCHEFHGFHRYLLAQQPMREQKGLFPRNLCNPWLLFFSLYSVYLPMN